MKRKLPALKHNSVSSLFCGEVQNDSMVISETLFCIFLPLQFFSFDSNQEAAITRVGIYVRSCYFCVCLKCKTPCICRISPSSSSRHLQNIEEFGVKKYFTGHQTINTIELFVAVKGNLSGFFSEKSQRRGIPRRLLDKCSDIFTSIFTTCIK